MEMRISQGLAAAARSRLLLLTLAGAALFLGGCKFDMAGAHCSRVRSDELRVLTDQTCRFRYDHGDVATYTVMVTRAPTYGIASGDGKYLKYTPKPGFTGEDRLSIKVVRKGPGNVQWQDLNVKVTVGPQA